MSDKSPRQNLSKKSTKSLKAKRADKRAQVQEAHDKEHAPAKKR